MGKNGFRSKSRWPATTLAAYRGATRGQPPLKTLLGSEIQPAGSPDSFTTDFGRSATNSHADRLRRLPPGLTAVKTARTAGPLPVLENRFPLSRVDDLKQNVPIDEAKFRSASANPSAAPLPRTLTTGSCSGFAPVPFEFANGGRAISLVFVAPCCGASPLDNQNKTRYSSS